MQPSEEGVAPSARRSIVAARDLPAGYRLTQYDLTWVRLSSGLPCGSERRLVGRVLRRPVLFGDRLLPGDVA